MVLTLLEKYPELIDYIDTSSSEGYLKIKPEGFEKVQENQRQKIKDQQAYVVTTDLQVAESQKKVNTRDFLKDLNFDVKLLSNEDAEIFAKTISENIDKILTGSNEKLIEALKDAGIDSEDIEKMIPDLTENIKNNLGAVSKFNTSMGSYTKKVESYTQTIATLLNSDNPKYQNNENKKFVDREFGKQYKDVYNKSYEEFKGMSKDDIAAYYRAYFGDEENDNL